MLCQQFSKDLLQHSSAPMLQAKSIKKWISGWRKLTESPDLNLALHLWDKLEHQLAARVYHPTSVPDLSNALVAAKK